MCMNNLFIEGPIQTGKSTTIRKVLKEAFGPELDGAAGFTSQRIIDAESRLLGFRLAQANAGLTVTTDAALLIDEVGYPHLDNVFKWFTSSGPRVDMSVFETAGIEYLEDAFTRAKSGQARLVLLDEIGGHELKCDAFRRRLYELLDSDIPCVGVIKSPANTKHMDDSLLALNEELHQHLIAVTGLDTFEPLLREFITSI